ncbi:hypothetical protein B2J88_10745 [Rhodococcus sp. SRB_17]|nr:hypothetical protein [Rhodococcus sp. SRB_17]
MKFSNALIGIGWGLAAGHASALSLGPAQGRVVLGQPIDLVFEVRTDPGVGLDAACFAADALQGETQIDSARLRLAFQPVVAGQAPTVRVRSSVVVNEPVLTVRLTAGCSGAIARIYHFFAELPASVAAGTAPVAIPSVTPQPAVAAARDPQRSAPQAAEAATAPVAAPRRAAAPGAQAPRKAVAAPAKPAARSAARSPAPVAALRSRLVMEPLGSWLDNGEPGPLPLRLSPQLSAPPLEVTDAQRAQAAALWKALNTPVSEVQEANARLRQQQGEADAARTRAAAAQAAAAELQQRLARDQDERFSASVVYALVALLAAALAVLGLLWTRARAQAQRAEQAWRGLVASSASAAEADWAVPTAPPPPPPLLSAAPEPASPAAEPAPVARERMGLAHSMVAATGSSGAWPLPAASAPAAPAEVVNPEDLFDLQQQAEFFVSVGEHDQAIGVMKRHIADNERSSPLAYLELLRLYHSLSRVGDFNSLRDQFHRYFNAQIPEFGVFHRASRTLLDWPEALAQIEALWSDAAVLALLDGLLFCHEGTDTARFDLAAYDDLLLLYAIARTTPPRARGAPPPRARTTPVSAPEPLPAPEPHGLTPQAAAAAALFVPSVPASLMDYDLELVSDSGYAALGLDAPLAAPQPDPLDLDLDLDLSEPAGANDWALPPLTGSELPAMPVTPPPQREQPRGFGAHSDRVEARFDLGDR